MERCKECGGELVHMQAEGDMVCMGCGLVNESYMIGEEVNRREEEWKEKRKEDWTGVVEKKEKGEVEELWEKYKARTKGMKAAIVHMYNGKEAEEICAVAEISERMFKEGLNEMKKVYEGKKRSKKGMLREGCKEIYAKMGMEGVKIEKEYLRRGKRLMDMHAKRVICGGIVAAVLRDARRVSKEAGISITAVNKVKEKIEKGKV